MSSVGGMIGVGNWVGVIVGGNHTSVGVMVAVGIGVSVEGSNVGVIAGDIEQADTKLPIKKTSDIFFQSIFDAIGYYYL
jgi:hypothetical protein